MNNDNDENITTSNDLFVENLLEIFKFHLAMLLAIYIKQLVGDIQYNIVVITTIVVAISTGLKRTRKHCCC